MWFVIVVFFFKQKTAYEMRISDWSSDVCSSDLAAIVTGGASGLGGATAERLARAGAKVTIFDMNAELGKKKAAEIGAHFVAVNVTDEAAVEAGLVEAEGVKDRKSVV